MKNYFKREYLFGIVYGVLIGTNIPYELNELLFWVVSFPLIVLGISVYFKLKE